MIFIRSFLMLVVIVHLITASKAEALYLTIENIGASPIVAAALGFDIDPFQEDTVFNLDLQLFSSRTKIDPTNVYLQFDETDYIPAGFTYVSPRIDQLTGVDFRLDSYGVSGFNIAIGGTTRNINGLIGTVIPGRSSLTEYNSDINFGFTLRFFEGGAPLVAYDHANIHPPVAEPSMLLLLLSGLVGLILWRTLTVRQTAS